MTPPFVIDTSALIAHYHAEPGHEVVGRLLEQHADEVFVSAITWLEFQIRLKQMTPNAVARKEALAIYEELLDDPVPVTKDTARVAFELREHAAGRLPNSDALIAATARLQNATLIHRDPHFTAIPSKLLRQHVLPDKPAAAAGAKS